MKKSATSAGFGVADISRTRDVVIVGGGLAGLSAAIYLGRALRDVLVVDSGKSMARWEPDVQNYLGFPDGISGDDLLSRGREQAESYGAEFAEDEVLEARREDDLFGLEGEQDHYSARRLLIATGIFHVPPELDGVQECLGHSMFFCKDCDGHRVQGKTIAIYGWRDETVDYALAMLAYTPVVAIVSDGRKPQWDKRRAEWIREYEVPVFETAVTRVMRDGCNLRALGFSTGEEVLVDALFTTRGDICFNTLAKQLGANLDGEGQIKVNDHMATNVPGLYAVGCVTPANCQMIIAAGEGAVAAQAINCDLFEESLATHRLRRLRNAQLQTTNTTPVLRE